MQPASSEGSVDGLVLAIDQGTTNTKALLVQPATGSVISSASRSVRIAYPAPGWVEQDARDLWDGTREALAECLAGARGGMPLAIAISNQRESVVAWHRRTGDPVGPVLGWQDARTAEWCAVLADEPGVATRIQELTGLSLHPMFSAPKVRWLLDNARAGGVDPKDVLVGTVDAWLIWQLTGEHLTEAGNASRTLLFNLRTLSWDAELMDLFGIPTSCLPEIRASDAGFGRTVGHEGVPSGMPVAAILADSHAAMYHHASAQPGSSKATYGTGSSVMTPCEAPDSAPDGVATTLAWLLADVPTYAREGNIIASGSALDWMARTLGAPEGVPGGAFLTDLALTVPDAAGVTFVPAFAGLGAPYWDRSATGLLTGVTAGATPAHLARAALEAVVNQVADVVEAIESDGRASVSVLHADGGASASVPLMRMQADVLGRPVHIASEPEASAWGAALLAARALGLEAAEPSPGVRIDPGDTDPTPRRLAWKHAVARSRGHAVTNDPPAVTNDPPADPSASPGASTHRSSDRR